MASIHKQGRNYYLFYRSADGKLRKRSLKTRNKATAEQCLKEFEARIAASRFGLDPDKVRAMRLKDFLDEALTWSRTNKSPATTVRDEGIYRQFLAFMGNVEIARIKARDIEGYKLHLLERGLMPSGVNIQLRHLSAAFSIAMRYDYLAANPFKKVPKLKVPKKKPVYLTAEQAASLLEALQGDPLYGIVLIALNTGARMSEVLGLKWEQVDLESGLLRVFGKGSRERTIPLTSVLRDYLAERKQAKGLVIGKPYTTTYVGHRFREAADKLGLPHFTFHNLRDTYASWLVQQGVNLKVIQEILGHSAIQTTMIYAHLSPDARFGAARVLDATMERVTRSANPDRDDSDRVTEAVIHYLPGFPKVG